MTRNSHPTTRPATDKWLDPATAQLAVLAVYSENGQRPEPPSRAAEDWTISSSHRRDLWLRSSWAWERQTNIAHHLFPLSEDAVCRLYLQFRKRGGDNVSPQQELFNERAQKCQHAPLKGFL